MTSTRGRPGARAVVACALLLAACRSPRPSTVPGTPGAAASSGAAPRPAGSIAAPASPSAIRLQRNIDALLDAPPYDAGTWGVVVRSLTSGEILAARNARKLLSPASNLKIVTLAAAAERLGWDYTYDTQLLGLGAIDFGFLDGDLIVRGTGDPSLSEADGSAQQAFRAWAERLKALGVRSLSGRIIGDDNAFDDEMYGSGWMWDDMNEAYSAGVGALQFNMGETIVTAAPASQPGAPAVLTIATAGSGLTLRNRVTTGASGSPARVTTKRLANSSVLEVTGSVPAGGAAVARRIAVDNQTRYFVEELRRALIAHGIDVKGPAVDIDDLAEPVRVQDAMPLVTHRSPPLRTLAATLMQLSQNQYAETFLKTLGAQAGTPTFEGGLDVVSAVLRSWGIDVAQSLQADGSGLSRYDLVSADVLAAILAHVGGEPRHDGAFRAALPVAATPGMLAERLKGTKAAGHVQAKTGSMRHVRSMSGYAATGDGEPVVFSIIANNFGIPSADVDRATDAIVLAITEFTR